ncbi:hypothetical protein HPK19_04675 [Arthrobacter citreus]|nr:hypothetical protein HPK19_04675 [Arthrobacter citreus]
MNSHIFLNEMRIKLSDGSSFTEEDLKTLATAASKVGSIESRVIFASVKQRFNSQPKQDDKTKLFLDGLERLKENGAVSDEDYETQKKLILEEGIEGA